MAAIPVVLGDLKCIIPANKILLPIPSTSADLIAETETP